MEILKIPTEENGIFLRQVTGLEDMAWFLTNRIFKHPSTPDKIDAPDHNAYLRQRQMWERVPEDQLSMGIWDNHVRFNHRVFAGYVTLAPTTISGHEGAGEVGVQICSKYQGYGYAKLGLTALMSYGEAHLGYDSFVADTLEANTASRALCSSIGFTEQPSGKKGHVTLVRNLNATADNKS